MKYFVVYDANGKILSVGSPAGRHVTRVGVRPRAGQHVHVIDASELQSTNLQLGQLIHHYRIDVSSSPPRLVRRD